MNNYYFLFIFLFCPTLFFSQTVTNFVGICSENSPGLVNGSGITVRFYNPRAIAIDKNGIIYVADSNNNCVRKISSNGVVSTVLGSSSIHPRGIAVDTLGNIYISDTGNHRIQKINAGSSVAQTLAGTGVAGFNNGIGSSAEFNSPTGIAVDATGNIFVADTFNHKIRKIDTNGIVTTFAGSSIGNSTGIGTDAQFSQPNGLVIDGLGNIYVADTNNHQIKKINSTGSVTNYVGNGFAGNEDSEGFGTSVSLYQPLALTIDNENNIYFISRNTIKKISAIQVEVTNFAGYPNLIWGGCVNGFGIDAIFLLPHGIAVNPLGNLFVADTGNNTIRKIAVNNLSLLELDNDKIVRIYPNPAGNNLFVSVQDNDTTKVSIFDLDGRLLLHNEFHQNINLDISDFSKGVYLIKISINNTILSKKIIKN